ncbi:MAG: DegT/DnrJ/EryC1/StrS family aminotransferase [Victivallales bacterium]|nr:DegT/DnrJ/EryC1/StrS family aminotransferase [Victivallales bacterium]
MMTQQEIDAALTRKPAISWPSEPRLGSIYGQEELDAVEQSMRDSMDVVKGFGFSAPPIPDFEAAFAKYTGTKFATAVNSCGPGIDIVMRYLKLQPGDEVIVPSINYSAAPLAVLGAGGTVIWGESDPETFMLDPKDVEKKITPRTRAIFPVHIHGCSAPMDEYIEIANRHPHPVYGPPKVIGDAARACGGDYNGTKIGKRGWATIYSFHTQKNMTTLGEGGMIVTDDEDLNTYAHSVRMYGGGVNAWGTSNVMTKVQAAVGLVQLAKLDSFIAGRRRVAYARNRMLEGVEGITLPYNPPNAESSFYMYPIKLKSEWAGEKRDYIIATLRDKYNVGAVVANNPAYMGRKILADHFGKTTPLSEKLASQLICLSIHPAMSDSDNEYITAAFLSCLKELD